MLVGGSVRDSLFGIEPKDFDIEVFGLDPDRLRRLLEPIAKVNTVGEHFAVYKLFFDREGEAEPTGRFEIDVSLPRRESKSGRGHRGFLIEGDPSMTFEEAARRRDFTINAVLMDPINGEIIDPFGGRDDMQRRVLRAVTADTFVEDSLRVLRAVQLAARFGLTVESQTADLCRSIDLGDLPRERVWGEVEKLLVLADRPSLGLDVAFELGVLDKLFPEIRALVKSDGDAITAPFAMTKRALDEASKLSRDLPREQRLTVMLAALCAGLGGESLDVAAQQSDRVDKAVTLLKRLGVHTLGGLDARSRILEIVKEKATPERLYRNRERVTDGDFRRLARRVDIGLLYLTAKAWALARDTEAPAACDWFITRARALGVEHGPPQSILKGRHLLELGFDPGPGMGEVIRRVYELQLDGDVTSLDEAVAAAKRVAQMTRRTAPPQES